MSQTPTELKYAASHEWLKDNGDGTVTVGISDHAQAQLGDIVFVELPEPGAELSQGGEFSVVESVKAASDIYSPISGEVLAVNEALADAPETINEDCYGEGWLVRLKLSDPAELESLLSADQYLASLAE